VKEGVPRLVTEERTLLAECSAERVKTALVAERKARKSENASGFTNFSGCNRRKRGYNRLRIRVEKDDQHVFAALRGQEIGKVMVMMTPSAAGMPRKVNSVSGTGR
jgi:hypothetical protein